MENIILHLKLIRGVRGVLLAFVVQCHLKVSHISPGYDAYLNLEEEMIGRTPIVNAKLNFKFSQDCLDRVYFDYQGDTFKIENIFKYQILSKIFMDTDLYVYVKQRKST